MTERLLILGVCVLVSVAAAAADTYRWEDQEGNVHYGDQLPPAGAKNIHRPRLYGDSPEQVLPYRLQVAVNKFPVTLYVTDCGKPCDMARELLLKRGVPHTLLDATSAKVQEELMALTSGNREVPVIKIGKAVVRGFEAGEWNGALDAAGYPSYPIIEVTPTIPQLTEKTKSQESDADSGDADETDTGNEDAEVDGTEDAQ